MYDVPIGGWQALSRQRAGSSRAAGKRAGTTKDVPGCLTGHAYPPAFGKMGKKIFIFIRCGLGSACVPTRCGQCVAHPPAELSLSKCPSWAERNSMLHGCPVCSISLNIFPRLHRFGSWVLTICDSALAWPCTTWCYPGPGLASRPPVFVKISLNYQPATLAPTDLSAVWPRHKKLILKKCIT